jgi:Major capsid protein 13-like
MAITSTSDLGYTPQVWAGVVAEKLPDKSALFRSSAIDNNPVYQEYLNGPGTKFTVPILRPLTGRSQVRSANNTPQAGAVNALVPKTLAGGTQDVVRHARGDAWAWRELAMQIAGLDKVLDIGNRGFADSADVVGDPLGYLEDMIMDWMAADMQTTLVQVLKGVFANTAIAAEHRVNYSLTSAGTATAANRISLDKAVAAQSLLGDKFGVLDIIVMHSQQYQALRNANAITFEKIYQDLEVPTLAGMQVLYDDNVEVIPAAGGIPASYATYFLGSGAIIYNDRQEANPIEVARNAAQDVDELYVRTNFILQPKGVSWTGSLPVGEFPTDAQLSTGTNWARVVDRKNCPIACAYFN